MNKPKPKIEDFTHEGNYHHAVELWGWEGWGLVAKLETELANLRKAPAQAYKDGKRDGRLSAELER
jgi:hypothetical protein